MSDATEPVRKRPAKAAATKAAPARRRRTEAEITDAAIKVFWRKGYAASNIQDVAEAVGVLKGSLYHYIQSKESLLFQIFAESHTQVGLIFEETAAVELPPLERVVFFCERYIQWTLTNVERATIYASEWRHLSGDLAKRVVEQRRQYDRFIRDAIVEAKARGEVDAGLDDKYVAFFILGAINGLPDWFRPSGKDKASDIATIYGSLIVGTLTGSRLQQSNAQAS